MKTFDRSPLTADGDERYIWTIGHSTRSQEEFVNSLRSFGIRALVDVRRFPGSKKYPQFNVSELGKYLPAVGISYIVNSGLGGRREPKPDSKNTAWRHKAFRGYADYTETGEFEAAVKELMDAALLQSTAYMCSEAVWWRCHRAIISDYLKERGWNVKHIMKEYVVVDHPFTSAFLEMHPEYR